MKMKISERGNVLVWLLVVMLVIVIVALVTLLFGHSYSNAVNVHMITEWPTGLMFVRDGATVNPQALLINLDEANSCIPADCVMAPLQGTFSLIEVMDDSGSAKGTGSPVGVGVQIRWFKNKDTTAMQGHLPYFTYVALSQFDNYGFQTGKHILSSNWTMDGKPLMKPDEFLLSYWETIECKIAFLGVDLPCNQTGWWPEEQGTWLFPVTPNGVTTSDVYVIKMNSSGSMSLFSIGSDFVTLADIQYIAEHRPEAAALVKLFYAEQLFAPSLSTPTP